MRMCVVGEGGAERERESCSRESGSRKRELSVTA
jgi:hypothetical protein